MEKKHKAQEARGFRKHGIGYPPPCSGIAAGQEADLDLGAGGETFREDDPWIVRAHSQPLRYICVWYCETRRSKDMRWPHGVFADARSMALTLRIWRWTGMHSLQTSEDFWISFSAYRRHNARRRRW